MGDGDVVNPAKVAVSECGSSRSKSGLQRQPLVAVGQWLVVAVLVLVIIFDVAAGLCFTLGRRFEHECGLFADMLEPWFSLNYTLGWSLIVIFMLTTYLLAVRHGRRELMDAVQLSEDFEVVEVDDSQLKVKALAGYGIATFGLAGFIAHLQFATSPDFEAIRWSVWPYVPLAKTGGFMLDFMLPLLLFPVMRHFMTWLRASPATTFLTLDANIAAHKFLGMAVFIPIALHVSMHVTWMSLVPTDMPNLPPGPVWRRLLSFNGCTGWIILICMLLMAATSRGRVRRSRWTIFGRQISGFDIFWNTHALYWLVYTLLCFHSRAFLKWAFWPMVLFLLDKALRTLYRHSQTAHKFLAGMVAPNILELKVPLQHFHYKPGQWAFICVPEISKDEWHPFTISSNPEAEEVTWHMDTKGDWCGALAELIGGEGTPVRVTASEDIRPEMAEEGSQKTEAAKAALLKRLVKHSITPVDHLKMVKGEIIIDGPYGSGSEHAFDYKKVILVSTGIGVTPFVSILKSVHARVVAEKALGAPSRAWHVPRKIYFFHVCRSRADYKWLDPILIKLEKEDIMFKPVIFVTRPPHGGVETLSGYPGEHRAGRPDWNATFDEVAAEIGSDGGEVGVFLCGSGAKLLQGVCTRLSQEARPGTTSYVFNKEVFT